MERARERERDFHTRTICPKTLTASHHHRHRHSVQSVKLYVKFLSQHVIFLLNFSRCARSLLLLFLLMLASFFLSSRFVCAFTCSHFCTFCRSIFRCVYLFFLSATHFVSRRKVHDTSCSIFHHILYMGNYSDYIKQVHINATFWRCSR